MMFSFRKYEPKIVCLQQTDNDKSLSKEGGKIPSFRKHLHDKARHSWATKTGMEQNVA